MTIICWDGRFVAADSQVTTRGCHRASKPANKLVRKGDTVYGCTGTASLFEPMIDWHQAGADPEKKPIAADDDAQTRLLVWKGGRCFCYKLETPYPEENFAPEAWGIAADYVMGAMDAGLGARQAVEKAIGREVFLGGPVLVMDLQPSARITKKALNGSGRASLGVVEFERPDATA